MNIVRHTSMPVALGYRRLLSIASLGACIGCAHPVMVRPGPTVASAAMPLRAGAPHQAVEAEPPAVEVRDDHWSPTVTVVGWAAEDAAYGLRTAVSRHGVGQKYHWLYVSTFFHPEGRSITQAVGLSRPLPVTRISRDDRQCYRDGHCSPYETFRARIPDEVLRANRDSIAVKFYARSGTELVIAMRPDVVNAYLGAVDSVTAAIHRR